MSKRRPKPIVVLHPAILDNIDGLRARLEREGYIVVVADDPAHVTFIQPIPPGVPLDLAGRLALEVVRDDSSYGGAAQKFAKRLLDSLVPPKPKTPKSEAQANV